MASPAPLLLWSLWRRLLWTVPPPCWKLLWKVSPTHQTLPLNHRLGKNEFSVPQHRNGIRSDEPLYPSPSLDSLMRAGRPGDQTGRNVWVELEDGGSSCGTRSTPDPLSFLGAKGISPRRLLISPLPVLLIHQATPIWFRLALCSLLVKLYGKTDLCFCNSWKCPFLLKIWRLYLGQWSDVDCAWATSDLHIYIDRRQGQKGKGKKVT